MAPPMPPPMALALLELVTVVTFSVAVGLVGDAVEGGAIGATTAIIGAGDVGAPVAAMPPAGESVCAVGKVVVGDQVDGSGVLVGKVGATTAIIGACDVGAPVATMPPAGESVCAVGEVVVGDLVDGTGILVGQTASWHCTELGTHGCPSSRQKAASTDDSTPCATIMHVAVDVVVPSPHVAVQDDCICCTHHPTAADTDGLRRVRRTRLTLHA
jgi:hypothetical protein